MNQRSTGVHVVLVATFLWAWQGATAGSSALDQRRAARPTPVDPRAAIVAAEDARIVLPDDLHTPAVDAMRASLADDFRLLVELTRSNDVGVQTRAIRALGRYERREAIATLLPFVTNKQLIAETAGALAQSMRGAPLTVDVGDQQLGAVFDALAVVGELESGGALGAIGRAIGRLPYRTPDQVQRAYLFLLTSLRRVDAAPTTRPIAADIARGVESLARVHGRLGMPDDDMATWLRRIVAAKVTYSVRSRVNAMQALMAASGAANGLDAEAVRNAAGDRESAELRRLAAVSLAGAGSVLPPAERTDLIGTLLSDGEPIVRIEAVRAWARQETRTNGCGRLLEALRDMNRNVTLAAIDALGDQCRDDVNVTDRLAAEARTPQPSDWHAESHALVALAKRAADRVGIPLSAHVSDPTWQVRMYAALAAALIKDVPTLERLAMDREDNVREAALPALRKLKGGESDLQFIAALGRPDYQLLRTAARELAGATRTPALAGALGDALRRVTGDRRETSRDARLALVERLQELGTAEQSGVLVPLLHDFDLVIAQAAASTLQRWATLYSRSIASGKPFDIAPQPLARPSRPLQSELDEAVSTPVRIRLSNGRVVRIKLMPEDAPLTTVRFTRLLKSGYYDGLTFHRIVSNFVIQGGSPHANEYSGDGPYMRDEIGLAAHVRGTVGVSTRGRDTGDAQFFINLVDNPRLDFEYTVFGTVDPRDMPAVDAIVEGDRISSIVLQKDDKKD